MTAPAGSPGAEPPGGAASAPRPEPGGLRELAALFLRLGCTSFGGPAAHVAMLHDEVVRRRRWVDEQELLDTISATNLVPGPNSTELAIHLGARRAGWRGLVVSGVCFILPAAALATALAWAYVRYGDTPSLEGVLYGVKPVVIAIVAAALWSLAPTAAGTPPRAALAVAAAAGYLAGVDELGLLAAAGLLGLAAHLGRRPPPALLGVGLVPLFLTFVKIGSVLYGSGYVLLAFLDGELVDRLGWLTEQQVLDAASVGQVTPGPVFTTATFVGYLVAGVPGAVVATVGIFLPSFVFAGLLGRLVGWLRSSAATGAVLDAVNAGALGLMGGVLLRLGGDALVDAPTVAVAAVAGLVLWRTEVSSTWLIAAGATIGLLHTHL
ncbi:MAG TPA: chromate transporter [Acidimicrobiales bacterium]